MEDVFLDYSNEIKIWDSSTICIVSVKHGLLVNRDITEFFENSAFIFVLGNDGKLTIDGLTYFVRSNCLLHIGPNRQISISSKEELEYFAVVYKAVLYPTMGRQLLGETLRENPFQRHYSLRAANPIAFSEHFVAMANEWSNPAPLSLLNIKQHFYSVICEMYAELSSGRAVPAEYSSFDFVYRYLQQNYSGSIMMHELADSLGIARSTLHKQFKEKIGVSPQQYLMSLRLDAASQLLVSSRMSVDEIASSCGIRDKSYMSRIFKEKYGLTPGEYRRENSRITAEEQAHIRTACPLSHKNKTEYFLIDNMGRIHRYYEAPRRIVCLDYAAAEICAALRMADRITGIASAEESLSDCTK